MPPWRLLLGGASGARSSYQLRLKRTTPNGNATRRGNRWLFETTTATALSGETKRRLKDVRVELSASFQKFKRPARSSTCAARSPNSSDTYARTYVRQCAPPRTQTDEIRSRLRGFGPPLPSITAMSILAMPGEPRVTSTSRNQHRDGRHLKVR